MLRIALLVACFTNAFAVIPLQLTDCNSSPNKIIRFENIHSETDPILIHDNHSIYIDARVLQPITGDHYKLEVTIRKKILFGWVIVPCIDALEKSTCSYELCNVLSGRSYNNTIYCSLGDAPINSDFPCGCPFYPGQYHLNPSYFHIDEITHTVETIFSGDYNAIAKIIDADSNEEVGCFNASGSIVSSACSGINCLIGKK